MTNEAERIMQREPKNIEQLDAAALNVINEIVHRDTDKPDILVAKIRGVFEARKWLAAGGRYKRL